MDKSAYLGLVASLLSTGSVEAMAKGLESQLKWSPVDVGAPSENLVGRVVRFDPKIIGKDTNFSGTDKVDLRASFTVVADRTTTEPTYPTRITRTNLKSGAVLYGTMHTSMTPNGSATTRMIEVVDPQGNRLISNASRFQVFEP